MSRYANPNVVLLSDINDFFNESVDLGDEMIIPEGGGNFSGMLIFLSSQFPIKDTLDDRPIRS